jgi:hypothetical protein
MLKDIYAAIKALLVAWREPPPTREEYVQYHDAKMKAECGIFDDKREREIWGRGKASKNHRRAGTTVAELIAYLQLQPQDAVVVQPRQSDVADAFIVFGLCSEPRPVQMRYVEKWAGYPMPIGSYEIDSSGELSGVLLE